MNETKVRRYIRKQLNEGKTSGFKIGRHSIKIKKRG